MKSKYVKPEQGSSKGISAAPLGAPITGRPRGDRTGVASKLTGYQVLIDTWSLDATRIQMRNCEQANLRSAAAPELVSECGVGRLPWIEEIHPLHVLFDTLGLVPNASFRRVACLRNLLYLEAKPVDEQAHRRDVGQSNELVLCVDSQDDVRSTAGLLCALPSVQGVGLLPYNRAAGGKHGRLGRTFQPGFEETRPDDPETSAFQALGSEARVLRPGVPAPVKEK